MIITVSLQSEIPAYEQIKEQIKAQILSGELSADEPLPSMRQLVRDLQVSVITTTRAYGDLGAEGLIYTLQGRGCFVKGNANLVREQYLVAVDQSIRTAVKKGFELKNISFNVPQGFCCGFIGPNGAGKTTTLKSMLGMTLKDSGEIHLLGKPDGDVNVKDDLGIMFDQPYFQDDWYPLDIEKGISPFYRGWDAGEYRKYLSRFELDPSRKFKDFSRGMKMKLAMAVRLSHNAKLLLLDEQAGGLDPVTREALLDILRDYLIEYERTVFFSTHITSDLERIADLIVYISHGVVSYCGEKDDIVWAAAIILVAAALVFAISYGLSLKVYYKREF